MTLTFRSDLKVELTGHYGTDADIARAAWVSSGTEYGEEVPEKRVRGLINALLRAKHGSPFEDGFFRFRFDVPRAVRDEAVRHRMMSTSSSSLRYTFAKNEVYVPPRERPFIKSEGFKQLQPKYEPMNEDDYADYVYHLKRGYTEAANANACIRDMIDSTEAGRWLTHDGTYVTFIGRFNPRSLMHFLGLRTHNDAANHVSYPMWEIEQAALQMEAFFAEKLPITYEAWNTYGREAP